MGRMAGRFENGRIIIAANNSPSADVDVADGKAALRIDTNGNIHTATTGNVEQHIETIDGAQAKADAAEAASEPLLGTPISNGFTLVSTIAGVRTWVARVTSLAWGNITGTLSDQSDLQDALDLKATLNLTNQPFKSATNSTTAFQIQQEDSTPVLNIDTVNGRVGIETDSPLGSLSVVPVTGKMFTIYKDNYDNPTMFSGDAYSDQATGLNFQVGRVGALSTSKGASFALYGNTQDRPTSTGAAGSIVFTTATDSNITSPNGMSIYLRVGSPSVNAMAIRKTGRVGITTTSPQAKLQIKGTTDEIQNIIQGAVGQTDNLTEWQNSSGVVQASIDPNGGLLTGSSRIKSTETSTTTATMSDDVEIHFCNSSTAYTLTLPTHVTGKEIKIINKGAGVVSLTGTINGSTSKTLTQYQGANLVSDGTNWFGTII